MEKNCNRCKKIYIIHNRNVSERKYCSKSCANKANASHLSKIRKGKSNPRYVHGLSSVNKKNGTLRVLLDKRGHCETCGKNGVISPKQLLVHHINKNRKDNRLNNLMVVCKSCHYDIHFRGGDA